MNIPFDTEPKSSVLLLHPLPQPVRIPISGANATDLQLTENAVSLIENLTLSALMGQMGNINENLSHPIDTAYAYSLIREGFKDLRDALSAKDLER